MKKIKMAVIAGVITFVVTFILSYTVSNGVEADTYIDKEYQAYCVEIGEEYCICPELLMAIIEAESSGKPNATNGSCKGLMQVADKWHTERMERLGVTDIYDPYGNILVAADYLFELFEKYGDVGFVLMTYNGDSRADDFAEGKSGLSEYAQKILARSEMLERIHGK